MVSRLVQLCSVAPVTCLYRVSSITEATSPRRAALQALIIMLRVSSKLERVALLLPKHSILPELLTELVDESSNSDYRKDILNCLSQMIYQEKCHASALVYESELLMNLGANLASENYNVFVAAARCLCTIVISQHESIPHNLYLMVCSCYV